MRAVKSLKVTLDLRHRCEVRNYITYRNYVIATGERKYSTVDVLLL